MASEITSDPASMLEGDMPESSMGRQPQGITINQGSLSNLLECMTQMLKQISMVQTNLLQVLGKEDTQPAMSLLEFPNEVVQEFQDRLFFGDYEGLLKMVNEFPAQLFLQTFDKYKSRSALHVAVMEGSLTLLDAILKKLRALSGGNDLKPAEYVFILKVDDSGLSAADMVALIGNKEIVSYFRDNFGYAVHGIADSCKIHPSRVIHPSPTSEDEKRSLFDQASLLLKKQAPTFGDEGTRQLSILEWLLENEIDFVYCLHKAARNFSDSDEKALEFVKFVCNNGDSSFLEPLLNVRDGLGRTPLHGFYPFGKSFKPFFQILVCHFPKLDWNMPDFVGRTPLHYAAAQGCVDVVTFLTNQAKPDQAKPDQVKPDLNATYSITSGLYLNQSANMHKKFVCDMTPLHLAVIHNEMEVVDALLKVPKEQGLNVNATYESFSYEINFNDQYSLKAGTAFQLAAFMGHERILQIFLEDPRICDYGFKKGQKKSGEGEYIIFPALHRAASQFHPLAVKTLVACRKMDALVKDKDGNTALHYAGLHAHGQLQDYANLLDYVTVDHFETQPPKPRKPSDHDIITCIEILMQSGLDMEQRNNNGDIPTLHSSCPEKVQTWWLQKMATEAQENKNNLITAANAVSVTAALVATASFVGPLQPPLGLLDDGNQTWLDGYSQVKYTSVQVFLFCDSLSFYLAIAAIVFAMLPSWPIPHEGLAQEVRIARRCVQIAVLLLFGSIIFVICAFSAASLAIMPDRQWRYKTIAVISTSLGVLICFLILFLSFMRLLALFSSRNEVAKKISNVATQIMLWERDTHLAK